MKEKIIKWALGFFALAALAPIAAMAVSGLVSTIVFIVLGLAFVNYMPIVAFAIATSRWKALAWWVRENPIASMREQYAKRVIRVSELTSSLSQLGVLIRGYRRKSAELTKKYPDKEADYKKTIEQFESMERMFSSKVKEAEAALKRYRNAIDEAEANYELAKQANQIGAMAKKFFGHNPMDDFIDKTAYDAVMNEVDLALQMAEDYGRQANTSTTPSIADERAAQVQPIWVDAKETVVAKKATSGLFDDFNRN